MVTVDDLADLLGVDRGAELARLQAAIDAVRVVDAAGRGPSDPAWEPTSDLWLAAAHYVDLVTARQGLAGPGVEQVTSEGTTIKLSGGATDLTSFAAWLRARSPLASTSQVVVVELGNGGDWYPRSSFPRSTW